MIPSRFIYQNKIRNCLFLGICFVLEYFIGLIYFLNSMTPLRGWWKDRWCQIMVRNIFLFKISSLSWPFSLHQTWYFIDYGMFSVFFILMMNEWMNEWKTFINSSTCNVRTSILGFILMMIVGILKQSSFLFCLHFVISAQMPRSIHRVESRRF